MVPTERDRARRPVATALAALRQEEKERELTMERTVSVELGGRTLSLQSGKIARQAGGSAVIDGSPDAVLQEPVLEAV